jgi:hypothetical protein
MIASPASKSTARSGNIVPRHLSQVFMEGNVSSYGMEAYPSEVLGKGGHCDQIRLGRLAEC